MRAITTNVQRPAVPGQPVLQLPPSVPKFRAEDTTWLGRVLGRVRAVWRRLTGRKKVELFHRVLAYNMAKAHEPTQYLDQF